MDLEKLKNLQQADGSFGPFHSMSTHGSMSTERALRRFYYLGLDYTEPCLAKTIDYVVRCLDGISHISDRVEKVIHWPAFCDLMFASWLTLFSVPSIKAEEVQRKWTYLIETAVQEGTFNKSEYYKVYRIQFPKRHPQERILDPKMFYCVVLLRDRLTPQAQRAYFDYVMTQGIYYIYDAPLNQLPQSFFHLKTFYYLEAVRLIMPYSKNASAFFFVRDWIHENLKELSPDSLATIKADGILFPKAGKWNKASKMNELVDYLSQYLGLFHPLEQA